MKILLLASLLVISTSATSAPVYKCDKNGVPVYTNIACPPGAGTKLDLPELSITSGFKTNNSGIQQNNQILPNTSSVTSDGQKKRESKRNDILQDELSREEDALAKAENSLKSQKEVRNGDEKNYQRVLDRLKPLEDEVELRKKNIKALQTEMGTSR